MSSDPFKDAYAQYRQKGWLSPLRLPLGEKFPPPSGWTGYGAPIPSSADLAAWADTPGNIGLRMPANVITLDVDDHDHETGQYHGEGSALIEELSETYGDLPLTWRSTRHPGVHTGGHYYFRLPPGVVSDGLRDPRGKIEVLREAHRFSVVWPSVYLGLPYQWLDSAGQDCGIPTTGSLPELPMSWCVGLGYDPARPDARSAAIDMGDYGALLAAGGPEILPYARPIPFAPTFRTISDAQGVVQRARASYVQAPDEDTALWNLALQLGRLMPGVYNEIDAKLEIWEAVNQARGKGHLRECSTCRRQMTRGLTKGMADRQVVMQDPPVSATDLVVIEEIRASFVAPNPFAPSPSDPPPSPSGSSVPLPPEDRSSWAPVDLSFVVAGARSTESRAVIGRRDDGTGLFYPGRVNGVIGESESGKSWVAIHVAAQELMSGNRVAYLDFEDSAEGVVERLRILGVTPAVITTLLVYVAPDGPLDTVGREIVKLVSEKCALIVVDGFNAAMGCFGLDLMSNGDCTKFVDHFLKPMSRSGACVLYIDHVTKASQTGFRAPGGIGAQAKRAATTGCCLNAEVGSKRLAPGKLGHLVLTVDKDRVGDVRRGTVGSGDYIGCFNLDSTNANLSVAWFSLPKEKAKETEKIGTDREKCRVLALAILEFVGTSKEPPSLTTIRDTVTGDTKNVTFVTKLLEDTGFLTSNSRPGGGRLYGVDLFKGDLPLDWPQTLELRPRPVNP